MDLEALPQELRGPTAHQRQELDVALTRLSQSTRRNPVLAGLTTLYWIAATPLCLVGLFQILAAMLYLGDPVRRTSLVTAAVMALVLVPLTRTRPMLLTDAGLTALAALCAVAGSCLVRLVLERELAVNVVVIGAGVLWLAVSAAVLAWHDAAREFVPASATAPFDSTLEMWNREIAGVRAAADVRIAALQDEIAALRGARDAEVASRGAVFAPIRDWDDCPIRLLPDELEQIYRDHDERTADAAVGAWIDALCSLQGAYGHHFPFGSVGCFENESTSALRRCLFTLTEQVALARVLNHPIDGAIFASASETIRGVRRQSALDVEWSLQLSEIDPDERERWVRRELSGSREFAQRLISCLARADGKSDELVDCLNVVLDRSGFGTRVTPQELDAARAAARDEHLGWESLTRVPRGPPQPPRNPSYWWDDGDGLSMTPSLTEEGAHAFCAMDKLWTIRFSAGEHQQ